MFGELTQTKVFGISYKFLTSPLEFTKHRIYLKMQNSVEHMISDRNNSG